MTTEAQPAATPTPASSSPSDDRATTFQAVQGEAAHYSGEVLLVSAYAALWTILLVWVAFLWRKQSLINDRLADLERVIVAADKVTARAAEGTRGDG